eukprot:TRINITY_DN1704_c0_g1_i1.p1 TRINITY_DN1704_c0_g1~~TRINITY_DN1704_c0_g1_i1.p1  ORF type:complete len:230 (+),score=57.89 TRINITY_DN1704_c0_g1_i1:325-1014(+)
MMMMSMMMMVMMMMTTITMMVVRESAGVVVCMPLSAASMCVCVCVCVWLLLVKRRRVEEFSDRRAWVRVHLCGQARTQIWDTAGQERFRAITSSSYRGSHGVLICYDCTSEKSFRNVRNWALSLRSHLEGTAQPSIYIAATKTDVADKRVVDTRSGEELAVQLQARHFDTSSKNSLNVEEVFMGMAREIVAKLAATEQQRNTVSVTVSLGPSSVAPQPRAPPPEDKCKC